MDEGIDASGRKGQGLVVEDQSDTRSRHDVGLHDAGSGQPFPEPRGEAAVAGAMDDDGGERPVDAGQAVGELRGDRRIEKRWPPAGPEGAVAAPAHQSAVENLWYVAHDPLPLVRPTLYLLRLAMERIQPWPVVLRLLAGLTDVLLPPMCVGCGERVTSTGGLCAKCWGRLAFIDAPRCERWGEPFAFDAGPDIQSARALAAPPPWQRLRAAVAFDDRSSRFVHALKYHDRHESAQLMAQLMWRAGRDVLESPGVIVPLPLHRLRLWRRRYNQATLLAERLARLSGLPIDHDGLARIRATRSQVGLDAGARSRNVHGAFAVPPPAVPKLFGRRVVLIDDVLTTGASAEAATEALLEAGAASVDVVVFALVVKPVTLDFEA